MKIVIIGADGQLGTDCTTLLASSHQLLSPTLTELDLTSEKSTLSYITLHKPDIVVNCAAYTAVDKCEEETRLCRQINSDGPGYLARACSEIGGRLVHISTDYVFDGKKKVPQPYYETDQVNPLSHYGRTKLDGEEKVARFCPNHLILRTAWLYSANGPNFLKTMLRLTVSNPKAVRKVVNDQYGSLTWSFTLARQIEKILESDLRGVVHTTSTGYSTWYEAACFFLEKMGLSHNLTPCSTADYPTPAHRPANSILANGVLETSCNSVFTDWREDLKKFVSIHGQALLAEVEKN